MRRLIVLVAVALMPFASTADALNVRDVIELSKAGVSDQVLLAMIEIDHRVYTLDAETVKQMKEAGVSDTVVLAMIRAGRGPDAVVGPAAPVQEANAQPVVTQQVVPAPEPQVVVIDHQSAPEVREVPVPIPVAVPVAVPVGPVDLRHDRVSTIVTTDTGAAVRVRVPVPANCVKAEPIYWGNGGKRRAGTWAPPTQVVCREH